MQLEAFKKDLCSEIELEKLEPKIPGNFFIAQILPFAHVWILPLYNPIWSLSNAISELYCLTDTPSAHPCLYLLLLLSVMLFGEVMLRESLNIPCPEPTSWISCSYIFPIPFALPWVFGSCVCLLIPPCFHCFARIVSSYPWYWSKHPDHAANHPSLLCLYNIANHNQLAEPFPKATLNFPNAILQVTRRHCSQCSPIGLHWCSFFNLVSCTAFLFWQPTSRALTNPDKSYREPWVHRVVPLHSFGVCLRELPCRLRV